MNKAKENRKWWKRLFDRLVMWWTYRSHPCYLGGGEFDHDLEVCDDSFDHEYGTERIQYMQCAVCGATHDEDAEIPEAPDDYFDDCDDIGPWPT